MQPPTPQDARRSRTKTQLMEIIRRGAGVTRADLCQITGMSRSAVAAVVQELLDERLVEEDVLRPGGKGAGRGRPSALLVPRADRGYVIGMDFAHTHVAVCIADLQGEVVAEEWSTVDVDGNARSALDVASGTAARLLDRAGLTSKDVRCAAAGIPAPIDGRTKAIRSTTILSDWLDIRPEEELTRMLGVRVVVANDADMGAQGELRYGAGRGLRDLIYLRLDEGLGAGLILDGVPYSGSRGLAGEVGHTQLSDQGTWCRCGNRGCLETVVSSAFVRQLLGQSRIAVGEGPHPFAEVASHPPVARYLSETGRTLGRVLADLCNWLNPRGIVLGGELGTASAPLVDGVREAIDRYAQTSTAETVEVRSAHLGLRAELLGAVSVAIREAGYEQWASSRDAVSHVAAAGLSA
ncbi:ROK family transcriptional regulator [Serinicoccus kebangsaanensis]|uniref:ROK family transcriptional regulator n=1 Tax=Serinicoccus kebangsaanensis TaxID=2602069 RepID=UPI00124E38AC|nr:ROK family transcriptional regulator [Serinicoccus kebangsaanensis]